jgi:hypothetical protein
MNQRSRASVVSCMSLVQSRPRTARLSVTEVALRVFGAGTLAVSAYVHLHLAHVYRPLGGTITQGDLFYVQGSLAAAVALWVLVTGHRLAWLMVALVGAASFAAVMVYRYVNVGAIGPIPNMYEPTWLPSPDKALSAVAEAVAVVVAAVALLRARARR